MPAARVWHLRQPCQQAIGFFAWFVGLLLHAYKLDSFPLVLPNLGDIGNICVRRRGGSSWYLAWVSIGRETASFYRWIPNNTTVCRPSFPTTPYTLKVKTSNINGAGTDADVFFSVTGSTASWSLTELDDYSDNWERNKLDSFPLVLPPSATSGRSASRKTAGAIGTWRTSRSVARPPPSTGG